MLSRKLLHFGILVCVAFLLPNLRAQFVLQSQLLGSGELSEPCCVAGYAQQGEAVALSADGTTAIVGGPYENLGFGAAWVFTRANGVWTQQGGKLVGSTADRNSQQGGSVAISADGNTALIGSSFYSTGGVWVFVRNNGV